MSKLYLAQFRIGRKEALRHRLVSAYEQEAAFQVGFLLRGELGRIQSGYSSLFL